VRVDRSERGSLPVVMLAILIVGSLATVLVGTMFVGQRQTRFDQSFEQSLQIAESGLDRMIQQIESKQQTTDFDVPETSVIGGRYSGTADRTGREWLLTSIGTATDQTSRTVTLTIRLESVFGVAAYGRTQVGLRGTNSADSYRSGTFAGPGVFHLLAGGSNICLGLAPADPFLSSDSAARMCTPTGHGVVATNGELFLRGGVIDTVDRAEIHYAREKVTEPLAGASGFCSGVAATCASSKLAYFVDPIELEPDPVTPPADLTNRGSFSGSNSVLRAGRQLYTNMTLDSSTVVQGTPENPSIVYLTGTLNVPNGAVVNFENVGGRWVPKPAPGLLVFSGGVGPALRFGNHASFAGAVYAPRATFSGGAAGNVYGSMVTGSVDTQGAWNFHYDEALGDVDTEARHVRSGWAEH
jgi:type II secretory pathway pseudopilin PulG